MATKKKDELGSTLLGVSENTARNLANYQAGYQEGERVQSAYNDYNRLKQNAPQAYVSPYQQQLDDIYQKITTRQPFKYNLNGDMLYQNAKEQYQQLGKQAMVDTIGQATQLTGGYGNSYAQNAGNQAYQQYLLKLNEQIPDYYRLAMERYNMEGDQLNNQYSLARDRESENYNRYRDTVSDYNNNLQLALNAYGKERDNDYGQYADALSYWQNMAGAENKDYWNQANFDYQKAQDALAQANWERQQAFNEMKYQNDLALQYAKLNSKGSGSQPQAQPTSTLVSGNLGIFDTISNALSAGTRGVRSAFKVQGKGSDEVEASKPFLQFNNLTRNTSADTKQIISQMDKVYAKKGNSSEVNTALNNDLEWYYYNGDITLDTVEEVLKHYGLMK